MIKKTEQKPARDVQKKPFDRKEVEEFAKKIQKDHDKILKELAKR